MSRRSLVSAAIVVAIALIAATVLARDSEPPPLEPQVEQRVREVIVAYELSKEPIVPEGLWCEHLDFAQSIALLRDQKDRQQRVAIGEAARRPAGEVYLGYLRREIARLEQRRGPGTMPVACSGQAAYWELVENDGDRVVIRAAAVETKTTARWDAELARLVDEARSTSDSAQAREYTLLRTGDGWRVERSRSWMNFVDGEIVPLPCSA